MVVPAGPGCGVLPRLNLSRGPAHQKRHNDRVGGETVGSDGLAGDGQRTFASAGWQYAAFQSNIFYIDTTSTTQWSRLTVSTPSPTCYTVAGPSWSSTSGWGVYFLLWWARRNILLSSLLQIYKRGHLAHQGVRSFVREAPADHANRRDCVFCGFALKSEIVNELAQMRCRPLIMRTFLRDCLGQSLALRSHPMSNSQMLRHPNRH